MSTQPNQTDPITTGQPAIVGMTWDELVATVTSVGDGVFLATTGGDGRPHVAWVMPGWADERMWITVFADSQKATNLRHCADAAMTCAATPEANVLIRATARLVTDTEEVSLLWNGGVLPYDPTTFFSGPDDPQVQFVELVPTHASVRVLGPGPVRRWRAATSDRS